MDVRRKDSLQVILEEYEVRQLIARAIEEKLERRNGSISANHITLRPGLGYGHGFQYLELEGEAQEL